MRQRRRLLVLITALFLFVVAQGFSRLATSGNKPVANNATIPSPDLAAYKNSNPQNASFNSAGQNGAQGRSTPDQNQTDDDDDPDRPPFARGIDKLEYLRLRARHIARLRGWEPGKPIDPKARGRAIRLIEQQEEEVSGKNTFLGRLSSALGLIPESGTS